MVDRALKNLVKMKKSKRSTSANAQRLKWGGQEQAHPELVMTLLKWFIDSRKGLTGRVRIKVFHTIAVELKHAAIASKKAGRFRSEHWWAILIIYLALDQEVDVEY